MVHLFSSKVFNYWFCLFWRTLTLVEPKILLMKNSHDEKESFYESSPSSLPSWYI